MSDRLDTAHIIYTGIIGFWHDKSNSLIHALAPNGRNFDPPHFTWLRCDCSQLERVSGLTPINVQHPSLFFYIGGTLSLDGIQTPEDDPLEDFEDSGEYTTSNLAPLKRSGLDPDNGIVLNRDLIGTIGRKVNFCTVVNSGKFDVNYVNRAEEWRFKFPWRLSTLDEIWKSKGWTREPLAEQVCHRVKLSGDRLIIKVDFGSGRLGVVELGVKKTGLPILAMIGNTDIKSIDSEEGETGRDHHVKLFHSLSTEARDASKDPLPRLPYLDPKKVKGGEPDYVHSHQWPNDEGAAAHGANCPPGWWEETSDPGDP